MVEGGALEVTEEDVVDGITLAHKSIQELIAHAGMSSSNQHRAPKMDWMKAAPSAELVARSRSSSKEHDSHRDQPEGQARAHSRRSRP